MSNDLLSGDFAGGIDRKLIKKVLVLSKAILSLSIVYTCIEMYNWFVVVQSTLELDPPTKLAFYTYRIYPFIIPVLFSLNVIAYSFNVRSLTMIDESVDEKEPELFNRGFVLGFRALKLSVVSICIAIITALIRIVLK